VRSYTPSPTCAPVSASPSRPRVSRPEEQLERLLAEGLTEVQGYRFSHPVPAIEVSKILGAADILAPAARETINAA
jgi:hypothetical protein